MTTILLLLPAVTALSPFATPKAWDAVSLGGPVVIKTGDTHTLFYHYRSVDDKDNEELPPLSTGRVGRAVSADGGLTFERQFDGLGAGGAVLSANVDDWYWFDSGHVGLGDVLYGGDATFLYTFGGSNSPMALRDVGIDKDGECYGMDLKMGVCVSQDGVKFGRIEGDEADGSILSPDPSSWERPGAPVGWPCVTRSPTNAETGELYLYYGATADSDGKAAVGVAKSKNGVLWTRCATAARSFLLDAPSTAAASTRPVLPRPRRAAERALLAAAWPYGARRRPPTSPWGLGMRRGGASELGDVSNKSLRLSHIGYAP